MANRAAIRFVRNLVAAFSRWKVSDETIQLYTEQLSNFDDLTEDQWTRALSRIVADRQEPDIPTLGVIYEYLKNQRTSAAQESDYGWLTFQHAGKDYGWRIKNVDGHWVFASMAWHRKNGERVEEQPNVGAPAQPPEGSTRIVYTADKPAHEELPSKDEARWAFRTGWLLSGADMGKCDAMFAALDSGQPVAPLMLSRDEDEIPF